MGASIEKSISERITAQLRSRIFSGEWKENDKLPSESELSKSFNTSPCTVKKSLLALKQEGLIYSSQGKGYFAKASKTRNWTIGVILYELRHLSNPVMTQYIEGIKEELLSLNCNMLLYALNDAAPRRDSGMGTYKWNDILDPQIIDGAIVLAQQAEDQKLIELSTYIPLAVMNRAPLNEKMVGINADFAGGAFKAVTHLAELGHKKIAILAVNPTFAIGNQQRAGARLAAIENKGIEIINIMASAHTEDAGYDAVKEMLSDSLSSVTAIITGSGELTLGAYKAIRERGLKIPENMSLIDWSDTLSSKEIPIPLTTIKMQFQKVGELAVRRLMQAIDGQSVGGTEVFLTTELIIRDSTRSPEHEK